MRVPKWIPALFWVAAVYDGVLGLLFLFQPGWAFQTFDVTPPNHVGYVQFPAALLIIFGIMFAAIARDPHGNRNLIVYGILLKVSYSGLVLFHWATTDLPYMWKPFCLCDLLFLGLFIWAWNALRPE